MDGIRVYCIYTIGFYKLYILLFYRFRRHGIFLFISPSSIEKIRKCVHKSWQLPLFHLLLFVNVRIVIKITELFIPKKISFIQIALLLLLILPMHFFSFRPDSFKVTFFSVFIFYFLRYHVQSKVRKDLLKALVAAIISIFFKHDVVIYIYLFIGLHWLFYMKKDTIIFAIGLSFITFSGFIFFTGLYGDHFIKNLFFYTVQYSSDIRINLFIITVNLLKTLPFLIVAFLNLKSTNRSIKFLAIAGCCCCSLY